MSTTIKGKKIATTKSGHKAVGPPAVSNIPPVAPPTPTGVPAPFPYIAESSSGSSTSDKLVIGGGEALVEGSGMDVSQPGNQASQPAPLHDLVTQAVNAKVTVTSGSGSVTAGGKPVATTLDTAAMNVMSPGGQVAQVTNTLVEGGGAGASSAAQKDNKGSGQTAGEPVDVVTGAVVDDSIDLTLPGMIPVQWRRLYSSVFCDESTPLGRGGWTFTLHQWIAIDGASTVLRNEDGRNLRFPRLEPRASAFDRCRRLALTRNVDDSYTLYSLATRLWRLFAPAQAGGRALLREIRDAWGNRVELRYQGERLTTIVDTAQRELRLAHDPMGRIARVEVWAGGSARQAIQYDYSDVGELARSTDALGRAEAYAYDGQHRLTRKTLTNGVCFQYAYDPESGRCVETWGDGGIHHVALEFDDAARTTHIHGMPAPRRFTWNRQGSVEREEMLDGEFADATTYDDDLYVVARANAAGETTKYEHDARGNCVSVTDPAGNTTKWEYANDLPSRRTTADGLVTEYGHDERGALVHITYPTGASYSLARDARGRLLTILGAEGTLLAREYDAQHNIVREVDACGAATTFTYDSLGRPLSRTDALGRTTRVDYDAVGQLVAIHYPDGTHAAFEHDARGNVSRTVDPLGQATLREYGGTGVLTKVTMPNGQSWAFAYDKMERLVELRNPMHETYRLRYDPVGRVEREETFDARVLRYQYSKANRLARVEYPDQSWRAFHYDPLGHVVLETSPHGPQRYTRDKLGRLLEAAVEEYNGKTVVTFERDRFGRVIAELQNGQAVRYAYDARGRRVSRTLPSGETTKYAYDPIGRFVGVDHDGHRVIVERDAVGREKRKHVERGRVDIMSAYDAMDHLLEQRVVAPSPAGDGSWRALARRQQAYDALGRVRSVSDDRWGITRYDYDPIDQLVLAQNSARHEVFDYDAAGSLQGIFEQIDASRVWSVAKGNILQSTPDARYEYDENHRRRRKIHCRDGKPTGEVTEYLWDCRDRLREVRLPDGARALYTYDAFGRRVRKEIVPKPTTTASAEPVRVVTFVWDGNVLAQDLDTEQGKRVFVHEPGTFVPMLQQERGAVFTYVNDHLGTPRELIDPNGDVAWAASYTAWGTCAREERRADVASPFRMPGQYEDVETGLFCTRFRLFDPTCARWLSGDPIGLLGGDNLFALHGSPTCTVDPLGLCATDATAAARDTAPARVVVFGSYNELRAAGIKDAHHIIQDAAVRDVPGYSRGEGPAVGLAGPSTEEGTPHYLATREQELPGGGSYGAERRIGYKALRDAGLTPPEARSAIEDRADPFFAGLGVTPDTPTRIPGNRRPPR